MFFLLQTFDFSIFKDDLRFWTSQSDKKKKIIMTLSIKKNS